jgi:MFS family permease
MEQRITFEKLSSESVISSSPASIRKWLRFVTVEGGFATVFITFTGGAFITGLALMLRANDFDIGLLAAIPFLSQVAQVISAYMVDRTGQRKRIAVVASAVARQMWWLVLPALVLPESWRLETVLLVVVFSNLAIMIATPAWLSWMADLIPAKIRGRYFGFRSAVIAFVTVAATIVGGIVLDQFKLVGLEPVGFAIIIVAGCLFALAAVLLLNKLPDKPAQTIKTEVKWNHFLEPLSAKPFRHLLAVYFVWNFAIGISAAFFAAHMLTNLKMSFTLIAFYSSSAALVGIALNRPWGKLIDRFGCKPVVVLCSFGIALIPLIWWIPRPGYLWILAFESVYSGALWTGFNLAAFNVPLARSPQRGRTIYLAMFAMVTGLGFFLASLLGGVLAHNWRDFHWQVGPQTVVNYHLLFAISSGLRLLAALLLASLPEPSEKSVPVMIQFMGYAVLKRLSTGRQIFPRPLRMRNHVDSAHGVKQPNAEK